MHHAEFAAQTPKRSNIHVDSEGWPLVGNDTPSPCASKGVVPRQRALACNTDLCTQQSFGTVFVRRSTSWFVTGRFPEATLETAKVRAVHGGVFRRFSEEELDAAIARADQAKVLGGSVGQLGSGAVRRGRVQKRGIGEVMEDELAACAAIPPIGSARNCQHQTVKKALAERKDYWEAAVQKAEKRRADDGAAQKKKAAKKTLKMTPKCIASRAYHQTRTRLIKEGKSKEEAKAAARKAHAEAMRDHGE